MCDTEQCVLCYLLQLHHSDPSNTHLLQPTSTINLKQQRKKNTHKKAKNKRSSSNIKRHPLLCEKKRLCLAGKKNTSMIIIFDTNANPSAMLDICG